MLQIDLIPKKMCETPDVRIFFYGFKLFCGVSLITPSSLYVRPI